MKKYLLMLLSLICIFAMTACSGREPDLILLNDEEIYPSGPASLAVIFNSIEEISDYSALIVDCNVESSEVVMVDGFPQTHSTVTVHSVLKGDISEGESILVLEEGGITPAGTARLTGVPWLEIDNHYMLFLVESQLPGYEDAYYISGAFQGKFIEKEGYYFQQATENTKLSLDEYYPQTMDEFSDIIK